MSSELKNIIKNITGYIQNKSDKHQVAQNY